MGKEQFIPDDKAGPEEIKAIKEEINKEGADLFIGTREEVDKAKERAESEGYAENVEKYLGLNSDVVLPHEEFNEEFQDNLKRLGFKKGNYFLTVEFSKPAEEAKDGSIVFFDKDMNVKQCDLDVKKIASFQGKIQENRAFVGEKRSAFPRVLPDFLDEMEEVGFVHGSPSIQGKANMSGQRSFFGQTEDGNFKNIMNISGSGFKEAQETWGLIWKKIEGYKKEQENKVQKEKEKGFNL